MLRAQLSSSSGLDPVSPAPASVSLGGLLRTRGQQAMRPSSLSVGM